MHSTAVLPETPMPTLPPLPNPPHAAATAAAAAVQPSRRQWLAWAGAAGLAPLLPACGGGDAAPGPFDATIAWGRSAIREAMQAPGNPPKAVSVALLSGGRLVWQEAFGSIDAAGQVPATTETRFNVGSVSKVLAALAVSVLVDRGLVELDAPIVRYLPQFRMRSPGYRDITVRHLLSHASGLPGTFLRNMFTFAPMPGYAEALEASLADLHLKHAPGEMAMYCNDGFTMVERVVHAVTGQDYPRFVTTALLEPLGMQHSGYTLAPLPAGSFAPGFIGNVAQGQEFTAGYATGGLCTTPSDMMKLAAMLLAGGEAQGRRVVSAAGVAEMGRLQNRDMRVNLTPEWAWGLGWDGTRQLGLAAAGVQAWQKNGGTMFYSSDFFVLPEHGMALLITGNASGFAPGPLAEGILLRALQQAGAIRRLPSPVALDIPALAPTSASEVQAVLGIYGRSAPPLQVASADSQQIELRAWDPARQAWAAQPTRLRLRSDGWWWSDTHPSPHYRWEVADGRRYLLARSRASAGHYFVTEPIGQQMPTAPGPLPAAWAARRGSTWKVVNESPDSVMARLGLEPATVGELPELPGYVFWDNSQLLLPLADDRAGMAVQVPLNAGRDLVELVVQARGGSETLHAAGWEFERMA